MYVENTKQLVLVLVIISTYCRYYYFYYDDDDDDDNLFTENSLSQKNILMDCN